MTETRLLLCDCRGSQSVIADELGAATGVSCSRVYSELCRAEIGTAANELKNGDVVIACQQERQTFEDLAAELVVSPPSFVDIRDRAGWSDDPASPTPKMAALIAEALLPENAPKVIDVTSAGTCLILGDAAPALAAAEHLCELLSVTVLLAPDAELPLIDDRRFDIVLGTLASASGALGHFKLSFNGLQERIPSGRGPFNWTEPRSGGRTECDILLDLRRAPPLFPADHKREGYLRADPHHAPSVTKALLEASQLVGTFEKPIYVKLNEALCAHSRAQKTGCTRCLDLCPTGAITPSGDHIAVDPMVCAGCGSCSAVCPSGAISYDAPPVPATLKRLSTLSGAWRKLSEKAPRLLVHDQEHGADMIRLSARYGKGLPADVIPFETEAIASFGHAEALAAVASGFASVAILVSPTTERDGLPAQLDLANAIAGDERIGLIDPVDPDQLDELLYRDPHTTLGSAPVLPMGTRRQVTRLAAKSFYDEDKLIPLPAGAPYGAVTFDEAACTLCMSCTSLCPSGALKANPDQPQLQFQEDACLQCGICTRICPENALSLDPRLNLSNTALSPIVLKEEEPFHCIECSKPFGVRSTVERMTEKLAGKHSMFQNADASRLIQMCDDCRVNAVYHSENNPFAMGERPKVRTTDDYISKRRDH
ncbi:4Fe-4S dicluster domain-containing protein [Roseibium denhamense]|uniref:4Fe-4S dicluster domain-containing protein n=1 Tax=Roseibium denhamense TaxID=76305 RepID=A0ABY1NGS8_9HYPH|nr:4Fe-4S binding protein [Roseibium denhamense]MTI06469.1 4Fe-4S dicluster domain-containing protein [Roseibium denhamense]SMP09414.1 4Fe-4S dicluster domain-containing protein [Roseibium denhamense]